MESGNPTVNVNIAPWFFNARYPQLKPDSLLCWQRTGFG